MKTLPLQTLPVQTLPPIQELEKAFQRRDAAYDGIFFVGVRTTSIFCRPTCPARKPLSENVEYFASAREALGAGYRPCKRCRPLAAANQAPWVETLLADIERAPTQRITESALRKRGIDPASVRRHFLKHFGMTFQTYARARRLGVALRDISAGAALDDVVLDSGFESHSGFRDAFGRAFGLAPGRCRRGPCAVVTWTRLQSPLGPLIAAACDEGVCLLEFADRRGLSAQVQTVHKLFRAQIVPGQNEHLQRLQEELAAYFAGTLRTFSVPLSYPGSAFQRRVWDELLRIPYGETRSYEDLAVAVGAPGAQRAVGRANGQNRLAIVIPCHRVVNKNGRLGGYGGGLRRKEFLLQLERTNSHVNGSPRA